MTRMGALRAATIALLATAASVAAPARLRAQDLACDAGDKEVRALEFRGNRAISDADLAVRVVTTPSSWARRNLHLWFTDKRCLNPNELPRDLIRIKTYYRDRGYYTAKVDTLVQDVGRDAVRVVFLIDEREPLRLTSYSITGLQGVPDSADIMRRLQLRVGQPFDVLLYTADIDTIVHRLREAGYYRATYVPGFEWDTVTVRASASIAVIPGKVMYFAEPKLFINPVDSQSRQQIADPVVRRVLQIAAGERFSDRAIVDAQRNLFQLGTYQHIEVAPLPDSLQPHEDSVLLAVRLTEDYMRQLDSEYGWATLDCGRVRLQYTDRNLAGSARRLELTTQVSKIGYGSPLQSRTTRDICTVGRQTDLSLDQFSERIHYFAGATLRQPRLLGTRWVPTVALYSERRGEFRAYLRSTQVGADAAATRDLGDRTPLRLAYTMEYGKTDAPDAALCALFNRCDTDSRRSMTELATLGVASAALARIRTDNAISPTRGWAFRSEVRTSAARLLGTSASLYFNKATGDLALYHPLGIGSGLALRLRGGVVVGRRRSPSDPTGFIPPQERLYAGGPTSVRGFQQNELGELVYIARSGDVEHDSTLAPSGTEYIHEFHVTANPDSTPGPDRSVPLGGNSLVVANLEYRIRDPFFFPDLLQYTLFLDGGDLWTRKADAKPQSLKWTPGVGFRVFTPVGPVQVNVGYNRYDRVRGPLYFNPDVNTLACATPGNTLRYTRNPTTQQYEGLTTEACPDFQPPTRRRFFQKLTFTFSIGPDF